jgi:hypothetical protein
MRPWLAVLALCPSVALTQDIVAHLDNPPFTLVSAGSNVGVSVGGPIGWLRQPADMWATKRRAEPVMGPPWFELGPGDSAIAATAADPRLASAPATALRVWRTVVAQSPATPLATLLAIVRADQTLSAAVATNPRLLQTSSAFPLLGALADANDQVGAIVVRNPVLAEHPRMLATLAMRHPALWPDAMRRVLAHLPELAATGPIDDRLAVHLTFASVYLGVDSARVALARLPDVRRTPMAVAALALAADSAVPVLGLRQLIGRVYRDTNPEPWLPTPLGSALARSRAVRADHVLLWGLASMNGHVAGSRWRVVRAQALAELAKDRETSIDELRRVARALTDASYWHQPDPRMPARVQLPEEVAATALMRNAQAAADRQVLDALTLLPVGKFGSTPLAAAQRLRSLPRA